MPVGTVPPQSRPEDFVATWNELCGPLSKVRGLTEGRRKKLRSRIAHGMTPESFAQAVRVCASTPFLTGTNKQLWRADFDWLVDSDTNLAKVLEGKYDSAKRGPSHALVGVEGMRAPEISDEVRAEQADSDERSLYMYWKTQPEEFKRKHPWTGRRFDEEVELATNKVA